MELIRPMLPAAAEAVRNRLGSVQKIGMYALNAKYAVMKQMIVSMRFPWVGGRKRNEIAPHAMGSAACSGCSRKWYELQPTEMDRTVHNRGGKITSNVKASN